MGQIEGRFARYWHRHNSGKTRIRPGTIWYRGDRFRGAYGCC